MVVRQEKPMNEAGRAPKGRLTWVALAAIALFLVVLVFTMFKPAAPDNRGGEAPAAAGAPGDASPAPGSKAAPG
ncbi:hypothetical protein ACO2Q0_19410 [Phenylobacterium sp. VNQ135]|uniref:hypothetical protein n=1 Tax=Phenylobacterium sp. VNQ135 TaxID=3400922 RepID=UPI003BFCE966